MLLFNVIFLIQRLLAQSKRNQKERKKNGCTLETMPTTGNME
jgi:hypothetical protein